LVRLLLVLHDLSAFSPRQRVQQALEQLQPYLQQTGAAATLVHLDESAAEVRLTVPGNADAAAVEHVRRRVEWALMEVAPSLAGIEVTVRSTTVGLIPVSALRAAPRITD
jgi:Fe-S cluster biogenesis protein NfuA